MQFQPGVRDSDNAQYSCKLTEAEDINSEIDRIHYISFQ